MVQATLVENVKRRAYEIYQKRGGRPGHEQDDWLQAEKEVLNQMNNPSHLSQQSNKSNGKKRQPVEAKTY